VIGSAVHEAIDAQASGGDPLEAFEAYVEKERTERIDFYYETTKHSPSEAEMREFEESVELARGLVNQYFTEYGWENPLEERGLKYVATEVPFSIPIGTGLNFVGTFDGIATDIATESQFYLIENKTASQKPNIAMIQSSNQFVGYNWAFRTLTGQTLSGTLYNGIIKRIIKEPRVLKTGALSTDKSAGVTFRSFMAKMMRGGHDPVKYLDYLEYLQEREINGDDRFFVRDMLTFTNVQLDNWYEQVLKPISYEMWAQSPGVQSESSDLAIYPNFTSCDKCLVKDICDAMQLGEDVEAVKELRYEVKTYGTMEAVANVTPTVIASVSDLLETLNGQS